MWTIAHYPHTLIPQIVSPIPQISVNILKKTNKYIP